MKVKYMKKKEKPDINVSNIVLAFIFTVLTIFTIAILVIFNRTGGCPDVLVTSVFAACMSECGFLAWLKTNKRKYVDPEDYVASDDEEEE